MVNSTKNVILIGFMGTGKTSTGKILATRLGYAFIDLDQKIEAENKMTIKKMFLQYGEEYFRDRESEMVHKIASRRGVVVSTGGGTVKRAENIKELKNHGIVVSLTASVDAILVRTGRRGKRPVLDGQDKGNRRQAIIDLLAERKELYAQADYTVDTSERSPMQVVDDILRFFKREV
jgi:shikimate kinase